MANLDFNENEALVGDINSLSADSCAPLDISDELRERVYRRSSGVLRTRRLVRRTGATLALVMAYASGIATVYVMSNDRPEPVLRETISQAAPETEKIESPVPAAKELVPTELLEDPEKLNRYIAMASAEQRPRLMQRAGDRYLSDRGDVNGALYYYRLLLDSLPAEQYAEMDLNDTWLLISMKQARQQETKNENSAI